LKHGVDKHVVEDSIQNVFINLIKFRKGIGEVKNLSGYLVSSFRRQLFADLTNQNKTILTEQVSDEQFDYFKSSEQDISDKEKLELLHATVKECIGNLTAKQQEILFLRFENGISYEEISELLHISVDSCYKSVYRSIKIIRGEVVKLSGRSKGLILWVLSDFTRPEKIKKYKTGFR
jgi:RNA polymerase sigma factor (sigma-70 family)